MPADVSHKPKPFFFIHTIDPIIWPILMLFIRPFFRIICFQYHRIKKIGFHRLEISSLSAEEFAQCNYKALEFAARVKLSQCLNVPASISGRALEVSNYIAKDFLRYATDLILSTRMIAKLEKNHGVFILPRYCPNISLQKEYVDLMASAGSLRHAPLIECWIRWWYNPACSILKNVMYWAAFGMIVLKKRNLPKESLAEKIIFISNIPSELQPDILRQLSAGFFIDGNVLTKKDVLFLTRPSPEAEKLRQSGFCVHHILDFAQAGILLQALGESLILFIKHPVFVFRFLLLLSPRLLVYLILFEIMLTKCSIRGLMYTNSDVLMEPIISISLRARKLPVVLFYYSASSFTHPMWSYLQADHIFVWNREMIDFINMHPQNGQKKFMISGPLMQVEDQFSEEILSTLQQELKIPCDPDGMNIGVFDIAPVKDTFLEESRFVQNPKLTSAVHRDFLFDIFSLAEERRNISMILKPKRWTPKHDIAPETTHFIETHQKNIILLPPSSNPQIAIQSCQLVICFPFTSIFFAALQKNIPAIFYYPFKDPEIVKISEFRPYTIYGRENLQNWFKDFEAGQIKIPSPDEIFRLCGIESGVGVREHFISQLAKTLYVP